MLRRGNGAPSEPLTSGRVSVSNADNGGTGVAGSPAFFDYSTAFGPDFAPSESSAARRLKFSNPSGELFKFTAVVYAHVPDPAFASAGSGASGGASSGSPGGGSGTGTQTGAGGISLPAATARALTFTVNPLTGKISILK